MRTLPWNRYDYRPEFAARLRWTRPPANRYIVLVTLLAFSLEEADTTLSAVRPSSFDSALGYSQLGSLNMQAHVRSDNKGQRIDNV